jgi:hypothetical protein
MANQGSLQSNNEPTIAALGLQAGPRLASDGLWDSLSMPQDRAWIKVQ